MGMIRTFVALLALFSATSAFASDVTVQITNSDGATVSDAVVTIKSQENSAIGGKGIQKKPEIKTIDQKDETFIPYVETFRPGDQVIFRNSDHVMHHVYSFSSVKSFEYPITSGTSTPLVMLDQEGVAAVGCNIHDHMITYLFVSDAPWMAKSGKDGKVTFTGMAAGSYVVRVWHPQLHPARPDVDEKIRLDGGNDAKSLSFSLSLLPDPRAEGGHGHGQY